MTLTIDTALAALAEAMKGGPGSGNFGHAGRPGKVGGSARAGSGSKPAATRRLTPTAAREAYEAWRDKPLAVRQEAWNSLTDAERSGMTAAGVGADKFLGVTKTATRPTEKPITSAIAASVPAAGSGRKPAGLSQTVKDMLIVESGGDGEYVNAVIHELAGMPEDVALRLKKRGVKIYLGDKSVVDLDDNQEFKDKKLDFGGGQLSYGEHALGMYNSQNKKITIGSSQTIKRAMTPAAAAKQVALHEVGHAVEEEYKMLNNATQRKTALAQWNRLKANGRLTPYETEVIGYDIWRAPKEMLAETFATLHGDGRAAAVKRYDEAYVAWYEGMVK